MKVLLASLTVFAMFFGAGNLIYPIFVGLETKSNFSYGALGFGFTGVLLPLLGLVSMIKMNCDIDKFFASAGKHTGTVLIVIILLLLGPLGAIPRCIIIPFEALQLVTDRIGFIHFNLLFGGLTFIFVLNESKIVQILGKWLTPALIAGILVTVISGFLSDNKIPDATFSGLSSFGFAAIEGYQTMDVCAAFFFAKILLDYFKQEVPQDYVVRASTLSSIFGIMLLGVVYAALLFLGAKYSTDLAGAPKASLFSTLTDLAIGRASSITVAVTVFFACLTTVIALVQLVSHWLSERFNINLKVASCMTIVCSIVSASFGFQDLTYFLARILGYLYPALIALSLCNMLSINCKFVRKYSPMIFWCVVAINIYMTNG